MISLCDFELYFPNTWFPSNIENLFMYLLDICISSLKKCLSGFCDNFYSLFCLFVLLLSWMSLIFWVLTPFQIYNLKIFSHSRLLFHFIDGMLSCAVAFQFEIVPLFFFGLCFWHQIQKIITKAYIKGLTTCFLLGVLWFGFTPYIQVFHPFWVNFYVSCKTVVFVALLPRWLSGKQCICQCRKQGFNPLVRKILWRKIWQPTPVFLTGEPHGQRSPGPGPGASQRVGQNNNNKDSGLVSFFTCVLFSQLNILKRLSFPHRVFITPLSYITWLYMCVFIVGLYIPFHCCLYVFNVNTMLFLLL